jgi:hypothetical protein
VACYESVAGIDFSLARGLYRGREDTFRRTLCINISQVLSDRSSGWQLWFAAEVALNDVSHDPVRWCSRRMNARRLVSERIVQIATENSGDGAIRVTGTPRAGPIARE